MWLSISICQQHKQAKQYCTSVFEKKIAYNEMFEINEVNKSLLVYTVQSLIPVNITYTTDMLL